MPQDLSILMVYYDYIMNFINCQLYELFMDSTIYQIVFKTEDFTMKKLKMARGITLTFEEGCNKYLENCRQRNLREGTTAKKNAAK